MTLPEIRLRHRVGSRKTLVSAVSLGLAAGLVATALQISLAAMIFSGDLQAHASRAAGLTMFGGVILAAVVAVTSTFRPMVSHVQDAPVAALSVSGAAVYASLSVASPESVFPTVVAIMAVSAILTGLVLYLVGRFGLSDLVRYLPYPVVGGYLAGTGWLLCVGGVAVISGLAMDWSSLPALLAPEMLILWVPAVAYGAAVLLVLERATHPLVLPGAILLGLALCYLALLVSGVSMDAAAEAGLFLEGLPGGQLWPVLAEEDLGLVDWGQVMAQVPAMLTVVLLCLVTLTLYVTGLELTARRSIDMDGELVSNGVGNVVAGLVGSSPGFSGLALSSLGPRSRVDSRVIGLSACVFMGAAVLFGGGMLQFVPKPLFGSLLVLFGLSYLKDWVVDARTELTRIDYALVLVILACVAAFGFLQGVAIGLVLTVLQFVFRFSRVPVIDATRSGVEARSHKARSIADRRLLHVLGHQTAVYDLSGYIFFGSANRVAGQILDRLESPGAQPKYVVLDCQGIHGYDASAVYSFIRLAQKAITVGSVPVFVRGPSSLLEHLDRIAGSPLRDEVLIFDDRDVALEWCEDRLLEAEREQIGREGEGALRRRDDLLAKVSEGYLAQLGRLEDFERLAGTLGDTVEEVWLEEGTVLAEEGGEPAGVYVVHWGSAAEIWDDGSGGRTRVRGLGPGAVIGAWCLWGRETAPATYETESKAGLFFISGDKLSALERAHPERALVLYRELLSMAGWRHLHSADS